MFEPKKIWLIQNNEGRFLKAPSGMYSGDPSIKFVHDFVDAWIFRDEKYAFDVLKFGASLVEYELIEKRKGMARIDWKESAT